MTGEELKERREEAGLTQIELSRRLGMSDSIVSYWEKGTRQIPAYRIPQLDAALGPRTKLWDTTGVLVLSWH